MAVGNKNQRLNGLNPLAYIGDNSYQPPEFLSFARPPTTSDSLNVELGTIWLDVGTHTPPTAEDVYMLVSLQNGVATWVNFAGGVAATETLTGNSGGPVAVDGANNINVVGDGTTISIAGNPGTHTLTASTAGTIATSYVEDAGSAVPAAGILNVLGGTGCSTSGAGNTITINLDGSVADSFPADVGTATPAAGVLNIFGGTGCSTTGAGNTITVNLDGSVADSFPTDSGTATPSAGVLNILGDGGGLISTSAPGPANTVQINAVYSHGTWTPALSFGGSSTGITYSRQLGEYIKIGQLVFVNFDITLTSKGAQVGIALIENFPFSNAGGVIHNHVYAAASANITFPAGTSYIGLAFAGTTADIEAYGSGIGFAILTDANFANDSEISGSFCYSTGAL